MDPHLACQDINMWADKLADSSGSYTIDGWPPSGSQEVDYSGTWSYSQSQGGDQVIAVINVQQLIANAQANGDTAAHQGFHFKLDLSQDPQKHKTFWVNCTPSSSSSGSQTPPPCGCSGGSTQGCSSGSMSGSCNSGGSSCTCGSTQSGSTQSGTSPSSNTAPSSSTAPSSTASSTPSSSVKAKHLRKHSKKHKKHKKHRKLVRPHRRHHAARRSVSAVSEAAPAFTG